MRVAGDDHDPARLRLAQGRQQQPGEGEVAEVVGAQLALEAVSRPALGDGHDAGVGHQQVQRSIPRRGERTHRGEVGQVQLSEPGGARPRLLDQLSQSPLTTPRIAAGQGHHRAPTVQLDRGAQPDAAVRAGDHGRAPVQRGDVGQRPGRRCRRVRHDLTIAETD